MNTLPERSAKLELTRPRFARLECETCETYPVPFPTMAAVASVTGSVASGLPSLAPGEEIYGLNPVLSINFPWLGLAVQIVLLLAGFWVAMRLVVFFVNRGLCQDIEPPPPPPDPLEEALEAIQRLKSCLSAQAVNEKDLCEKLATILKVFVFRRVHAGFGSGSTTDELLAGMRFQNVKPVLIEDVQQVQTLGDAVKFARGNLGALTPEELVIGYETLIKRQEWTL